MKTSTFKSLCLAASLTSFCWNVAAQDNLQPRLEQIRREARDLLEKARDLKADGKNDEAETLARKAQELRRRADELTNRRNHRQENQDQVRSRPSERESAERRDGSRRVETEERVERRVRRFDEGNQAEDRDRIQPPRPPSTRRQAGPAPQRFPERPGFQRRDESGVPSRPGPQPPQFENSRGEFRGQPGQPGRPGAAAGPGAMDQFENRRQHVQEAIKHLHAAGLHEPAEQLAQRLNREMHDRQDRHNPEGFNPHQQQRERREPRGEPEGRR
jgi:hypothetical protein